MIELHAWITIRETYKSTIDEEDNIELIINDIKKMISDMPNLNVPVKSMNGTYFIEFSVFSNRHNNETYEAFEVFNEIGKMAPGSYGLIYLYDDESFEHDNEFQVFSLTKGKVKKVNDYYLSPITPTIEDM